MNRGVVKASLLLILAVAINIAFGLQWLSAPPESFEYGPILSWVGDPRTTITITWQMSQDARVLIRVGNETWHREVILNVRGGEPANVTFAGLMPGSKYWYFLALVEGERLSVWSGNHTFETAPATPRRFRVLIISDTQVFFTGQGMATFRKLIETVSSEEFDFIIHVGDLVEHGRNKRMWALFLREISKIACDHPLMAVAGNHDCCEYGGDGGRNFKRYLSLPGGEFWYSFNYSNAVFLALDVKDCKHQRISEEEAGLAKRALSYQGVWKIAYFHIPVRRVFDWSCWNESLAREVRDILSGRADLVIMGHQHGYARWSENGTKYVVVSSASWYAPQIVRTDGLEAFSFEYGYGLMEVDGSTLRFTFKRLDGKVIDEFLLRR